jgi:hypothetical protein
MVAKSTPYDNYLIINDILSIVRLNHPTPMTTRQIEFVLREYGHLTSLRGIQRLLTLLVDNGELSRHSNFKGSTYAFI